MTSSCPNAISSALAAASPPSPPPSPPFSKQTRFSFSTRSSSRSLSLSLSLVSSSVADARFPVSLAHRRFLLRLQELEELRHDVLRSLPSSSSSSPRSRPPRRGPSSSSSRVNFATAPPSLLFSTSSVASDEVTPLSVGKKTAARLRIGVRGFPGGGGLLPQARRQDQEHQLEGPCSFPAPSDQLPLPYPRCSLLL